MRAGDFVVRDIIAMIILTIVSVLVIPFAIICMSAWLSGIC